MNGGGDPIPLLVGEISVDFTMTEPGRENKLRLGGVAHAARGFWALDTPFSAAVVLPSYLEDVARRYFDALGCVDFRVVGYVRGAPNVTVIFDATEVADQGYETLLREEKKIETCPLHLSDLPCQKVLVFPGTYDLAEVTAALPDDATLHIDVAYDVNDPTVLANLPRRIETILISTSSQLFKSVSDKGLSAVREMFECVGPATLILKENRGGARLILAETDTIEALPAQLGTTANSVGVGDVFAAAYVALSDKEPIEAGWRATYAAAAYSQTTYPDLFRRYVRRDLRLTLEEMRQLGGAFLPWEQRPGCPIYLAAPDFTRGERRAIDKAIASLQYHNFDVRRPIVENGELPLGSSTADLQRMYQADYELLKQCSLVFAVPSERDPGSLVEVGIAIEAGIPVVIYDPSHENANTMLIGGAAHYSANLDECLNSVFRVLSSAPPK